MKGFDPRAAMLHPGTDPAVAAAIRAQLDGPAPAKGGGGVKAPKRTRGMNRWESAYATRLRNMEVLGEVLWWRFEAVTLRIGEDCRYRPDFTAVLADGSVKFIEVKGFKRDDALVKFKSAAELYPWAAFEMVTKDGDGWRTLYLVEARLTVKGATP